MNDTRISYAQNREDVILAAFFEESEVGFYVDVGANHPVHESVTKLFYDRGWSGMNLEPTSWLYELLCLTRPRDMNVQMGVSNKAGSMLFREYPHGNGLSTFSAAIQKDYEQAGSDLTRDYKEYEVPVRTLAQIFADYRVKQIDFMKVDIEGYEYEALEGNDWAKYRPKVLCIEANHIVKDWHPMIKKAGYSLAFFDGLNEYFVAQEESSRLQRFSYPDRILLGPQYVRWGEWKIRQLLERDKRVLEYKLHQTEQAHSPAPVVSSSVRTTKQKVKHGLRKIDAGIEHRLSSQPRVRELPVPAIRSAAELNQALIAQVRATGGVSHRATYLNAYHTLKRKTKRAVRRRST